MQYQYEFIILLFYMFLHVIWGVACEGNPDFFTKFY